MQRVVLVVAAVIAMAGCTGDSGDAATSRVPSTAATATTAATGLTYGVLSNVTVPAMCDHPEGRLVEGRLPVSSADVGELRVESMSLVDLGGPEGHEGLLHVVCTAGGNQGEDHVLVYGVGPSLLGDVQPDMSSVGALQPTRDGLVVLGTVAARNDPSCCPGVDVVQRFTLDAGGLRPDGEVTGVDRDPTCFDDAIKEAVCRVLSAAEDGEAGHLSTRERAVAEEVDDLPPGPWRIHQCALEGDVTVLCDVDFPLADDDARFAAFHVVPWNAEFDDGVLVTPPGEPVLYEVESFSGVSSSPADLGG